VKKLIMLPVFMVMLVSCAHRVDYNQFVSKVNAKEARNTAEIKEDIELMLKLHPQMNEETKEAIRGHITTHIDEHQRLKDQESKIVQVLLEKSITSPAIDDHQHNGMKDLDQIYQLKAKNISKLITSVKSLTANLKEQPELHKELQILMKELR
jgi:hypothetical protein